VKKCKWIHEWPTEPGSYWFYGCPYDFKTFDGKQKEPELNYVEIKKASIGLMVIRSGQFWYKKEWRGMGMFSKIKLPELPILKGCGK